MERSAFDDKSVLTASQGFASPGSASSSFDEMQSTGTSFFFPLKDELSRTAPPNNFFTSLSHIIQLVQCFFLAYLPFYQDVWSGNNIPSQILKIASYILDFGARDENYLVIGGPIYTILIVTIIYLGIVIFMCAYYNMNKTFSKISLHITRIVHTYIIAVVLIPSFTITGFCFNQIFGKHYIAFIFATIAMVIFSIILLGAYCFELIFRGATIYMENTLFTQWYSHTFSLYLLINCLCAFSTRFINEMPIWSLIIMMVVYVALEILIIYRVHYCPFIKKEINALICALSTSQISAIIMMNFVSFSSIAAFVVPIGVFIIAIIIFVIDFNYLYKSSAIISDFSNEKKAIRALRIIFQTRPDLFVTWENIKSVHEQYDSPFVIIRIAKLICFFSSESLHLNMLIAQIGKYPLLPLVDKVLYYQIRRAHFQRQSWSTKQANFEVTRIRREIMTMTVSINKIILQFMDSENPISLDMLMGLATMRRSIKSSCREAMDKYPNNPLIAREYSRFLVECCSDFMGGIRWKVRTNQIESGKISFNDLAFVRMVNVFPNYLRIMMTSKEAKGTSTDGSTSQTERSFSENTEISDELARGLIDKPKLRIAYKNAVDNMNSSAIRFLIISFVASSLFSIAAFVFMFIQSINSITTGEKKYQLSELLGLARETIDLAFLSMCMMWSNSIGATNVKFNTSLFVPSFEYISEKSGLGIQTFMEMTYMLSYDSNEEHREIFLQDVDQFHCTQTELIPDKSNGAAATIYTLSLLNCISDFTNWENDIDLCSAINNLKGMSAGFALLSQSYVESHKKRAQSSIQSLSITVYIVGPILLLVMFVPNMVSFFYVLNEVRTQANIIKLLPGNVIKEASKPLTYTENELVGLSWKLDSNNIPRIVYFANIVLCSVVLTFLFCYGMYRHINSQHDLMNHNIWIDLSGRRAPSVLRTVVLIYTKIINYTYPGVKWLQNNAAFDSISESIDQINEAHLNLIKNSGDAKSCNGASPVLDELHYSLRCDHNSSSDTIEASYECLSVDQMIVYFNRLAADIYHLIQDPNGDPSNSESFKHLTIITLEYLVPSLIKAVEIFKDMWENTVSAFHMEIIFVFIGGLLVTLVFFFVSLLVYLWLKSAFKTMVSIIGRLPPAVVAENESLRNLITNKPSVNIIKCGIATSIIQNAEDSFVIVDQNGLIEFMNNGACKTFGYTREQMSNQPVSLILDNAIQEEHEYTIVGHKDNGKEITFNVSRYEDGTSNILHLRNITRRITNQHSTRRSSRQSGNIVKSLLPLPLQNQMDDHIGFEAPFVAIVVLNVERFNDYISALSPESTLRCVERLFQAFSDVRTSLAGVELVEVSGDVFTAVVGVFEQDNPETRKGTVNKAVLYALDCIRAVEDVNQSCESSFAVRAGIFVGGPVTCGLFGECATNFAVIGQTVQDAHKMELAARTNTLAICQSVLEMIETPPRTKTTVIGEKDINGKLCMVSCLSLEEGFATYPSLL